MIWTPFNSINTFAMILFDISMIWTHPNSIDIFAMILYEISMS